MRTFIRPLLFLHSPAVSCCVPLFLLQQQRIVASTLPGLCGNKGSLLSQSSRSFSSSTLLSLPGLAPSSSLQHRSSAVGNNCWSMAAAEGEEDDGRHDNIVQYVIMRRDLSKALKWSLGAVVAQACHACISSILSNHEDANVKAYLNDMDRMHKVILGIDSEESLRELSDKLTEEGVDHKLWIEQPENVATCIATKPQKASVLSPHFLNLKLLR
eukprot:GHVS01057857.1.p1 GENE.GHVS01057857.1~~GHVS01057857.1.p1  ORF type:complete len:214 (+),score=26.30 GHVS01057857.1:102-743(+)